MSCQVAQRSISKWTQGVQPMDLKFGSNRSAPKAEEAVDQINFTAGRSLEQEMEAWRRNSKWIDERPALEVRHLQCMGILWLIRAPASRRSLCDTICRIRHVPSRKKNTGLT